MYFKLLSLLLYKVYIQGFWYLAGKKAKFRGIFSGKFVEKLADFAGLSWEKSQNSRKNRPISGGNFAKTQSVKKQPISRDIFWQISLTLINFVSIWKASFNVFLAGIIICSFNNSSLEKWTNLKAVNIMVSAQFFATFI